MRRLWTSCIVLAVAGGCDQGAVGFAQAPVETTRVLDIAGTGANGELVFEYAVAGTRLSNGSIVIADGLGATVRFFDASGKLKLGVGRQGEGPGEFEGLAWLGQCGRDSVFAWDRMLHRITVIDAAGEVVRTYRVPADFQGWRLATLSCSRTGIFAFLAFPQGTRPPSPTGESPHFKAPLSLADATGKLTHSLGEVAVAESRPLGKATSIAVSADRLYVGTKDSAFVDMYDLDGQRIRSLPVHVPVRAPTMRHYERAIDQQVAWLAVVEEREQMRQVLLDIPMPEYAPPYGMLFTDPGGILWIETSILGDPMTTLRAIDTDGHVIVDVILPPELRVLEVGRDYILATFEEEGGEPHVAMYRMNQSR